MLRMLRWDIWMGVSSSECALHTFQPTNVGHHPKPVFGWCQWLLKLASASVSWKVFQSYFNPYPKTPWDNHKSSHLCRMPWHYDKIVVGSILRHTVKLFCHIGKSLVNSTWTFRLQVKEAKNDEMSAVENFTSCSHTNSILQCLFELSGLVHCYKIHVEKIDNVWVKIFGH